MSESCEMSPLGKELCIALQRSKCSSSDTVWHPIKSNSSTSSQASQALKPKIQVWRKSIFSDLNLQKQPMQKQNRIVCRKTQEQFYPPKCSWIIGVWIRVHFGPFYRGGHSIYYRHKRRWVSIECHTSRCVILYKALGKRSLETMDSLEDWMLMIALIMEECHS